MSEELGFISSSQTDEARAFIERILTLPTGPGVSLDQALGPSLDDEAELRRLFAIDKNNTRLKNPHVGLVDVFDAPVDVRTTRARAIKDDEDLDVKHVMPLDPKRRRADGSPSTVQDLDEFKKNWAIFTENSLSQLHDWSNIVAAGGSVLACLAPLPEEAKASRRATRKYFHSEAFPNSDVDLFLWGLDAKQAEIKMNTIYEAVRDSVPWDVTCVRTRHTVSIHCQYPYRCVQIVLRLYRSPAEILAGFDVDAPCCAYDGNRVWANPRALVAMMRQCNSVDMTRRSPSYEVRLAKYSARDFEVHVPALRRADVDPTIFERSINRIEGLARLLVLEKLKDTEKRTSFLNARRKLRGRPDNTYQYRSRRRHKNDLKADPTFGILEMNDYDVGVFHVPYGPGWDAKRIEQLIYKTDFGTNTPFNPKNKGRRLHRHPAFFGTMQECLEDCCQECPDPEDEAERNLQAEEDKHYVRHGITFLEENPGRQSISGSFNPIDVGEWSAQVYVGETEKLCNAIVANDRIAVALMINSGFDVNRRDHVGRTPLHLAILSKMVDIACDLVDAGARITARLVDGRTPLHLAAQMDLLPVVKKLLARSADNAKRAEEEKINKATREDNPPSDTNQLAKGEESDCERPSSEDDWSSEESEKADQPNPAPNAAETVSTGDIPEDDQTPDILDINLADWDRAFTPLLYAVLYSSVSMVHELLGAGADPNLTTKTNNNQNSALLPLAVALLRTDEDNAAKIAERLCQAGASSSAADAHALTLFHRAISFGNISMVKTLLQKDPNAAASVNFPFFTYQSVTTPLATAVANGFYSVLAILLAYGAHLDISSEDVQRAEVVFQAQNRYGHVAFETRLKGIISPLEIAIARHDDIASLLTELGADVNRGIYRSLTAYAPSAHLSLLDWVRSYGEGLSIALSGWHHVNTQSQIEAGSSPTTSAFGWKGFYDNMLKQAKAIQNNISAKSRNMQPSFEATGEIRDYIKDVEKLLPSHGAKTWDDIYPDKKAPQSPDRQLVLPNLYNTAHPESASGYTFLRDRYYQPPVGSPLVPLYDELYEACFAGNNEKIRRLCLPQTDTITHSQTISLNIQVQIAHGTSSPMPGCTPLFAAVSQRHWKTAQLIVAIAAAQYGPDERVKNFLLGLDSDDDSSDDSNSSCDSDVTVDDVKFIDIAKLSSQVQFKVSPEKILRAQANWPAKDELVNGTLLEKAVFDDDLEAFRNVADLYKTLDASLEEESSVLAYVMLYDRPAILDEYIRRTGCGIDADAFSNRSDVSSLPPDIKSQRYSGLLVHGKRRKSFAEDSKTTPLPLLWHAALAGAKGVISYLGSDRPLEAYRFYYSTNRDERSHFLRTQSDLEKVLPEWLGWSTNALNESPLAAAVLGNKLECLKMLISKSPSSMKSALHAETTFYGFNLLMLAVIKGCEPKLVDYLLANGASPIATSNFPPNWNIFHILAKCGYGDLLEHLLSKLPSDISCALLTQQSKVALDTPLHIAVESGRLRIIQLLLPKSNLLTKNINGNTPLHIAVQSGFPEVTRLLTRSNGVGALYAENGVGETPMEIAIQRDLLGCVRTKLNVLSAPKTLDLDTDPITPARFDTARKAEVAKLKNTLNMLVEEGTLKEGTNLFQGSFAFVDRMEGMSLSAEVMREEDAQPRIRIRTPSYFRRSEVSPNLIVTEDDQALKDEVNTSLTLQLIQEAVSANPGLRSLLHLLDVQKSVQDDLRKSANQRDQSRWEAFARKSLLHHSGVLNMVERFW